MKSRWRPVTKQVMGYELSDELIETISEMLEETEKDGLERGVAVCLSGKNRAVPGKQVCTGDECSVTVENCGTGTQLGLIHTHPGGDPEPSLTDALAAISRKKLLAGKGLTRTLNCNVTAMGPRGLMTCITPKPSAREAMSVALKAALKRGMSSALAANPEVEKRLDVEEVPLVSDQTAGAIMSDPVSWAEKSSHYRREMLAVLNEEQIQEAMAKVREKRWEDLAEVSNKARAMLCGVSPEGGYCHQASRLAGYTSWKHVAPQGVCSPLWFQNWVHLARREADELAAKVRASPPPGLSGTDLKELLLYLDAIAGLFEEWQIDFEEMCTCRVKKGEADVAAGD